MRDDEFENLLELYLEPPSDPNPQMADVEIVWVRGCLAYGSQHIFEKHGVTEEEVEQVLLEIPPYVEARKHHDFPLRTVFWGATRLDRWLVVVCEDWEEAGKRYLKPITAFEPKEGAAYWSRQ